MASSTFHQRERRTGLGGVAFAFLADRARQRRQRVAKLRRSRKILGAGMDGDLARTLHGDVTAVDGDVGAARRRQGDALGRRPVDIGVGADQIDVVARLHFQLIGLRLDIDGVLGRDQLQANALLARLDRAAQHADGLAAVQPELAAGDVLAVAAAHQRQRFAVGQLQALPGRHAQTVFGGDGDDGRTAVRQLAVAGAAVLARRIGLRRFQAGVTDHAGHRRQHRLQRRRLLVEYAGIGLAAAEVAGVGHGLMRLGRLAEGLAQLDGLLHQRDAGRVVAHRFALGGTVADLVARDEQARAGAHHAVGIGAQLGALPAQDAAIVVGAVDQVAQRQLAGGVRGAQLHAALRVGVVEQQLAVAGAAELLAAHAPLGRAVAVACAVARGAVPWRAVATGQIALGRYAVVVRRIEHGGAVRAWFAAWRTRHAAFALAVVQRTDDDGAVDIV